MLFRLLLRLLFRVLPGMLFRLLLRALEGVLFRLLLGGLARILLRMLFRLLLRVLSRTLHRIIFRMRFRIPFQNVDGALGSNSNRLLPPLHHPACMPSLNPESLPNGLWGQHTSTHPCSKQPPATGGGVQVWPGTALLSCCS